MASVKILGICGSLRKKSSNRALLQYAQSHLPAGVEMVIADLSDIPFYNKDIVSTPESVLRFYAELQSADALMLACPEYNYSMAPALKNALDWASVSDDKTLVLNKPTGVLGAGGGMGTSRAQYHLRQVAVYLQLDLLQRPEIFCNAFNGTFDDDNNLIDAHVQQQIGVQMRSLREKVLLKRKIGALDAIS